MLFKALTFALWDGNFPTAQNFEWANAPLVLPATACATRKQSEPADLRQGNAVR